jgi:hypothetical protein
LYGDDGSAYYPLVKGGYRMACVAVDGVARDDDVVVHPFTLLPERRCWPARRAAFERAFLGKKCAAVPWRGIKEPCSWSI